MTPLQF